MKKICKVLGEEFEITESDLVFYKKMGLITDEDLRGLPKLCPEERQRRRLFWRNERSLYWRECDGTGKKILSIFSKDKPFKIYDTEYWYSDNWNSKNYGRDFDFSRPFFEQFRELMEAVPQLARSNGGHSENSNYCNQADYLKNCYWCFDGLKNVQDLTVYEYGGTEFCYDNHEIGEEVQNICFSDQVWQGCHDIYYSKLCILSSHDLFGCVGLTHSKYCIFNKQYTKEEYFKLRAKIIEHMKELGEWGEFFPQKYSPFDYEETVANEYFPIEKSNSRRPVATKTQKLETGLENLIPENISDVKDDICEKILTCEVSGKKFKIQKSELKFYRKMNLPILKFCPEVRHKKRMALRNPRKLWERICDNLECKGEKSFAPTKFQTTFGLERPEKVFCEKCYLEVVD